MLITLVLRSMAITFDHHKQVVPSKVFSMCFKIGGGVLTLGGVDHSIHAFHRSPRAADKPQGVCELPVRKVPINITHFLIIARRHCFGGWIGDCESRVAALRKFAEVLWLVHHSPH